MADRMTSLAEGRPSSVAVRTRYFDDVVEEVLRSSHIEQVVMPAAGMDARGFRLDLAENVNWYELDQPDLLVVKEQVLEEIRARPRCRRHVLPVDLTSDWAAPLLQAGMDPERPTLWIVEGLVCYLTAEAVAGFLDSITSLSAPGSHLVADILGQMMLDRRRPWLRSWLDSLEQEGMGQQFATDDPEMLFESRGWECEVAQHSVVAREFGRWPYRVPVRGESDALDSFLVHARR